MFGQIHTVKRPGQQEGLRVYSGSSSFPHQVTWGSVGGTVHLHLVIGVAAQQVCQLVLLCKTVMYKDTVATRVTGVKEYWSQNS